jgi:hypothetical protein
MADEEAGYDVPDTSDVPKFWADGPNKGRRVSTTPVKVRSLKLDPDEHEIRVNARRLAAMGNVGQLEIEKEWARLVANDKENAYEMAVMLKENSHLRRQYLPPSRWPTYALVAALSLMVMVQAAMFFRRPTLAATPTPTAPPDAESASAAPSRQKGRVAQ